MPLGLYFRTNSWRGGGSCWKLGRIDDVCIQDLRMVHLRSHIYILRTGYIWGQLRHSVHGWWDYNRRSMSWWMASLGGPSRRPKGSNEPARDGSGRMVRRLARSEERRGGNEVVSTCRARWSPNH